ncbi:MAG: response regulator [Deltaproteobacteria bacterium]|nr:response regulator [Deltaproteobacteria bacterium]
MTDTPRPKMLIVDDHDANIKALERALKGIDCEIIKSHSGNEALALVLEHNFALILLDVQMPEMDGFETLSLIKLDEKTKHIPVIFVTALSKEDKHITKGYQAGAIDYLFKPIDIDILEGKVNGYLALYKEKAVLEQRCRELEAEVEMLKGGAPP